MRTAKEISVTTLNTNICIRGVSEGEETETGSEKILRNNR